LNGFSYGPGHFRFTIGRHIGIIVSEEEKPLRFEGSPVNYRTNIRNGDELSALGFGCMRFPKDDPALTEKLIVTAVEQGVNYFDSAYIYSGSEATLGGILAKHGLRDKVKIATKVQPFLLRKPSDLDKVFATQLERLQTDYLDYYLIHMLTDTHVWDRLVDLGIVEWIERKKAEGAIRNIGFSFHGGQDTFVRVCDAYDFEFCLIQYNYLDEDNQAGRHGLRYAHAKDMAVMIMEPLRGGRLVDNLPKGAIEAFENAPVRRSPAEWSLQWLWDQPEVTVVLSGMNAMDQLEDNIAAANRSAVGSFTEDDFEVIASAKQALMDTILVACTGCNYCMPCPHGVDIPTCFASYNLISTDSQRVAFGKYMMATAMSQTPGLASRCTRCGRCEPKCPQHIAIPDELTRVKRALEKPYFKPMVAATRWFMKM
jgi:predicted aldo/keto reductase-like oxidoreductase